ncbi:hypothetical protein CROQUDRAFT_136697, partial [Cronartium quercuum f. sp. fusiforme G11]
KSTSALAKEAVDLIYTGRWISDTIDQLNKEAKQLIEGVEEFKEEIETYHWSDHLGEAIDNIALEQAIEAIPLDNWASPIDSEPAIPPTAYPESVFTNTPRRFEPDEDSVSIATGYTDTQSQEAPPFLTSNISNIEKEQLYNQINLNNSINCTKNSESLESNSFNTDSYLNDLGRNKPFGIDSHSIDTELLGELPKNRIYQYRYWNTMDNKQSQGEGSNRMLAEIPQGIQDDIPVLQPATQMIIDPVTPRAVRLNENLDQNQEDITNKSHLVEIPGEVQLKDRTSVIDPIQKQTFLNIHEIHFKIFKNGKEELNEEKYKQGISLGRKSRQGLEALGMTKEEIEEEVKKWNPGEEAWNPYQWNSHRIARINKTFQVNVPQPSSSRKRKTPDSVSSKSGRLSKKAKALIKAQELLEGMSESD